MNRAAMPEQIRLAVFLCRQVLGVMGWWVSLETRPATGDAYVLRESQAIYEVNLDPENRAIAPIEIAIL